VRMNGKQHYLWREVVPLGVEEEVLIPHPETCHSSAPYHSRTRIVTRALPRTDCGLWS
jgi:hypothetical protein